ncbi:MAG: SprB repeat-containing protein, partial [Chitinophagaceae bacterium]|nr:SprB repeat-containing protein [Chitinophagaceae bacterium]
MNKFYKISTYFIVLFFALSSHFALKAQMTITPNMPANQMIDRLVGAGVTYFNPVLICPSGASGRFDNGILTTLAMDSGIVLTSGSAINTNLSAGFFTSISYGTTGGDADLAAAATGTIHDLCKLEFDFIPIGDTVKFNYRFGSEEYTNYTCSSFNDIFSFFISGPGYGAPTNVALIPGTNCPVSINTVNWSNANPCGSVFAPCAPPNNALYINNTFGTTVVYDGLTQTILAKAAVTPCSTYHMKFAIADVYDGVLDSGVFLEAGSFVSDAATITNIVSTNNMPAANPFAIEGCNSAVLTISRPNPKPYPQTVNLVYAGTATNGVDFPVLAPSVVIPAFAVSASLVIPPIEDFIAEGTETLKIYVYGTLCANYITDSVTIDILEYPTYAVSDNDTICAGQTATLTAIPNPANPNLTFSWTPVALVSPAIGNVVTAFPAATTTFTVTASYPGCPLRDSSVTIFVEPTPSLSLVASPILCAGDMNGSITATGNVNYFPISFFMQPGPVLQNGSPAVFGNLGAGIYTITVSSAAGCTNSSTIALTDPLPITWQSVNITNIPCGAANTGQIAAIAQGGVPTINYQLLPGGAMNNTGFFPNLGTGTYTISATDANGCSTTTIAVISQPQGPAIVSVTLTNPNCANQNGGINVVANGNNGIITYTLLPGNISNISGIFSPLTAGTYTIQVVDASNCTSTSVAGLSLPQALTVNAVAAGIPCYGGNTDITVNVNGGTPAFQYNINGGANQLSNIFNVAAVGIYTISVTDANGCTGNTTISITQPAALQISNILSTPPTCVPGNDASITISATGGPMAYNFNIGGPNQAGNLFLNIAAGTYTATVVDANGCTATSSITIVPPNAPVINNVATTDVICNGGNTGSIAISASGGIGTLTYTLQPGNLSNVSGIFSNLIAGTYTITVTDANGCTISSTTAIMQAPALNWSLTNGIDITCNGSNDGSITATAIGGTGNISYNLMPNNLNNNTGLFINLTAGSFTVTATDANGCTITTALSVVQPGALLWNNINVVNVNCNGGTNGAININASGGTGGITYNLQPNNVTNMSGNFTFLTANSYTVTASDANGCSISTVINLTQPAVLQITNLNLVLPGCVPGNDGSITVTASGGTPAYAYNIGGGNQAGNTFSNLAAGNYTVTITDANGCTSSSVTNLAPPNSPVIVNVAITDVFCNGASDGSVTTYFSGGMAPYNFTLMPGNITNGNGQFNNLQAALYTITMTDANGCTGSTALTIVEPLAITWTMNNSTDVLCFGGSDGQITVAANGGIGPIDYTLLPNNINNQSGIFTNITAGLYTVTAVDANGCSISTTIQINQPAAITWSVLSTTNVSCNGGSDGSITVGASGGNGLMTYQLLPNNISNVNGLFTNLTSGIYTIVVTDANGCSNTTVLPVVQPTVLQISNISMTPPTCVPGNDGSISITATGGTAAYSYSIGGAAQP